jgi:quinolinate synthase
MYAFKGDNIIKVTYLNTHKYIKHKCLFTIVFTSSTYTGLFEKDAYALYTDLNGFRF